MENTENKFKHKGVWYIAVEEESCRGCVFIDNTTMCVGTPECTSVHRKDNRSVIFVESDVDNLGDEK